MLVAGVVFGVVGVWCRHFGVGLVRFVFCVFLPFHLGRVCWWCVGRFGAGVFSVHARWPRVVWLAGAGSLFLFGHLLVRRSVVVRGAVGFGGRGRHESRWRGSWVALVCVVCAVGCVRSGGFGWWGCRGVLGVGARGACFQYVVHGRGWVVVPFGLRGGQVAC